MKSKINYQKKLEEELKIISKKTQIPKLLLHVCCAPCSSYVLEYLSDYFEITVLYYNPNIFPYEEYKFRKDEEKRLISEIKTKHPVKFIECDYDSDVYISKISGYENEPEGGLRCDECFKLRLEKSAKLCREGKYDYFTTTLTISPIKDADKLNMIGEDMAKKHGVRWLFCDFKKKNGYLRSIQLSKEHNLYRQNYCGCVFSKKEAQPLQISEDMRMLE